MRIVASNLRPHIEAVTEPGEEPRHAVLDISGEVVVEITGLELLTLSTEESALALTTSAVKGEPIDWSVLLAKAVNARKGWLRDTWPPFITDVAKWGVRSVQSTKSGWSLAIYPEEFESSQDITEV